MAEKIPTVKTISKCFKEVKRLTGDLLQKNKLIKY